MAACHCLLGHCMISVAQLKCQALSRGALCVWQGQTMGSSDITAAMDFNCRLMDVQIRLVEELTALQVKLLSCSAMPCPLSMQHAW